MTRETPRMSDADLLEGLRIALPPRLRGDEFQLISRSPNAYASSYPSELVRLRSASGESTRLFCKYGVQQPATQVHRCGISYEARVYRQVLMPLRVSAPRFLGSWSSGDLTGMALEALDAATPLKRLGDAGVTAAAAWLGGFHRRTESIAEVDPAGCLQRYDVAHFSHWMNRAKAAAVEFGRETAWLDSLARRFDLGIMALSVGPQVIVHGEFYPMNVLATNASIHPVDWESAGLGPGEIDLASLCMGWPAATKAACLAAYAAARWDCAASSGLVARVATARVYLSLRMLGDNEQTGRTGAADYFDYLLDIASECGLVQAS